MDSASPWSRLLSLRRNQLKHLLLLLAYVCSGMTRANFSHSESWIHSAPAA